MSELRESRLVRLTDSISTGSATVAGYVMALMALHIVTDVGFRYFAGMPLAGTTEIVSNYYMVTLIFLPLAYVQVRGEHIKANLFGERLPERLQVLLTCFSAVLMAIFAALLGWRAAVEAERATAISEQIQTAFFFLPTWPARWIPVLAMAMVVVVSVAELIAQAVRLVRRDGGGKEESVLEATRTRGL